MSGGNRILPHTERQTDISLHPPEHYRYGLVISNRLIWSASDSTRHRDTQTDDRSHSYTSGSQKKQHNLLTELILSHSEPFNVAF